MGETRSLTGALERRIRTNAGVTVSATSGRYQRRHHIGLGQGLEKGAGQALHEEDRQQSRHFDQRRVDDGVAHLDRGVKHNVRRRLVTACPALLAQAAHDVFYVDDGVVDDGADSDHQPRQHHHIDRRAKQGEHEQGDHHRQGDDRGADQGDTPIPKEEQQNHNHQNSADEQRSGEIVDRHLDEGRRPEDGGVDIDTGQTGRHLVHGRFHALVSLPRCCPTETFRR